MSTLDSIRITRKITIFVWSVVRDGVTIASGSSNDEAMARQEMEKYAPQA